MNRFQAFDFSGRNADRLGSLFLMIVLLAVAVQSNRSLADDPQKPSQAQGAIETPPKDERQSGAAQRASAVFAGGCFWCVESDFERAPGVVEIIAGYSGGRTKNPNYKTYASSGHKEVVFIVYDPTKVTYAGLVEYLLKHIDPTDKTGSFIDKGPQYAPAIYYANAEEKAEAQRVAKAIDALHVYRGKVNVPILPRQAFWPAEDYHQDYHRNNAVKYSSYRATCGRDAFVQRAWGAAADQLTLPGSIPIEAEKSEERKNKNQSAWLDFKKPSLAELRRKLTNSQFEVTQRNGTEPAYRNAYWNNHEAGIYVDVVSGEPLFLSTAKFDSGTGWPSFVEAIDQRYLTTREDRSDGMVRIEVRSRIADSHLGHVFSDGPVDRGGLRYCMNSASMRFVPKKDMEQEGYGEFIDQLNVGSK